MDTNNSKKIWWIIGIIVVAIVVVIIFMMSQQTAAPGSDVVIDEDVAEVIPTAAEELREIQQQGTSDAITDIEADLNVSGLDTLDQELLDIESELEGF